MVLFFTYKDVYSCIFITVTNLITLFRTAASVHVVMTKQGETGYFCTMSPQQQTPKSNFQIWVSVASRRTLGTRFSSGIWSTFLNTSKTLLIYIALHTFSHLFLAFYVLLNRTQGNS